MTQDQIIQVLHKVIAENQNFTTWTVSTPHLVSLVNYAIEAEREACAKVAICYDSEPWKHTPAYSHVADMVSVEIGKAIRARGEAQ